MSYRGSDRGGRGGPRGGPPPGRGGFDGGRGRGFGSGPPRGGGGGDRGRGGFQGGRGRGGGVGAIFASGRPAQIDARLTDDSEQALVSSFKSLKLQADEIPVNPGIGTKGVRVNLRANYFPVKFPQKGTWYEYNVEITPKMNTAMRRVKRRIFQLAEKTPEWSQSGLRGNVVHDHSSKVIACKKLPDPLRISLPYYDEDESGPQSKSKVYTLTFEFVQNVDLSSLANYLEGDRNYRDFDIAPLTAVFNILLAAYANRSGGNGVMVGRNRFFFPSANRPDDLGGGLEAWRGFYSSARPAHHQLMVNVNVATTAFYKAQNLAEAMLEVRNSSLGYNIKGFVKGLRVKTTHLGYRKSIKTLSNFNAQTYSFSAEDLGKVTVEQYFLKKYKIKLRYPQMPLVDVGGVKSNLLPPEVCEIIHGQPYRGKLSDDHTAAMIKVAARPPAENATAIASRGLSELGFNQDTGPLRAFNVGVGSEMAVVPGRILSPPKIQYGQGNPLVDDRASWNLKQVKFAMGSTISSWGVLLIGDSGRDEFNGTTDPQLMSTLRGFTDMCKTSGMKVEGSGPTSVVQTKLPPRARDSPIREGAHREIERTLKTMSPKPKIILVVLSSGDKHVYAAVKHLCDCVYGVPTVCVQAGKFRKEKGQLQYFANVALKFNMKLGGVNHKLDKESTKILMEKPTMIVGIDVTHPGPGSVKETPSIAAVVASTDGHFAQFPASMRIQKSKQEMVAELAAMMKERLDAFKEKNQGKLPHRILVYRDGVSEGQFKTVVEDELPKIREAFKSFENGKYKPALTIVICGKRHHTRFYPTDAAGADHNGNPKAGTCVDRGVTSIYHFDFFLQAHGGLQGTTRPTHYYVVHDDIGFTADDLQGLTNSISYMFARATKAVSLASPAYYADLACERGRCYLHKLLQGHASDTVSSASGSSDELAQAVKEEAKALWREGIHSNLRKTMFYL